ncbi:MAG: DUF4145 domain-containing protein [Planctomycetota bacterium]|jgi:hypothetical protein
MSRTDPKQARKTKQPTRTTATRKKKSTRKASPAPASLSIEEAWRYIDRFCRALWVKHMETNPPGSLAEAITALRDQELVPVHEAGMMHTIRALRNLLVHEDVVFGDHETTIARAAWEIVRAWGEKHEREAWRLTMNMCDRRAA